MSVGGMQGQGTMTATALTAVTKRATVSMSLMLRE